MSLLREHLGRGSYTRLRLAPDEFEFRHVIGRYPVQGDHERGSESDEQSEESPNFFIQLMGDLSGWLKETFGDREMERHEEHMRRKTPQGGGIRGDATPLFQPVAQNLTAGIRVVVKADGIERPLKDAARRALEWTGAVLQDEFRTRLGERFGPAPPGMSPGIASGRLADSVAIEFDSDGLAVTVGTNMPYAWYLEFGTMAMPARPFIRPIFEKFEHKILTSIREEALTTLRTLGAV